jgi:hypothetical protein
VSLGESSSFDVLTSESDIVAFIIETKQGQSFACRPVEIVCFEGLDSFVNVVLLDSWMDGEI